MVTAGVWVFRLIKKAQTCVVHSWTLIEEVLPLDLTLTRVELHHRMRFHFNRIRDFCEQRFFEIFSS